MLSTINQYKIINGSDMFQDSNILHRGGGAVQGVHYLACYEPRQGGPPTVLISVCACIIRQLCVYCPSCDEIATAELQGHDDPDEDYGVKALAQHQIDFREEEKMMTYALRFSYGYWRPTHYCQRLHFDFRRMEDSARHNRDTEKAPDLSISRAALWAWRRIDDRRRFGFGRRVACCAVCQKPYGFHFPVAVAVEREAAGARRRSCPRENFVPTHFPSVDGAFRAL
mmetsp:Transcript_18626/g.45700  ORF Transcript_18626/g.45700 Transcript_18626/m.45700 type:complete len:226 (-) Transcript_18626:1801-2478(-)